MILLKWQKQQFHDVIYGINRFTIAKPHEMVCFLLRLIASIASDINAESTQQLLLFKANMMDTRKRAQ